MLYFYTISIKYSDTHYIYNTLYIYSNIYIILYFYDVTSRTMMTFCMCHPLNTPTFATSLDAIFPRRDLDKGHCPGLSRQEYFSFGRPGGLGLYT